MDTSDTDIEKTYDIEQKVVIGKIHSMQWLKSNSQLSGYTKTLPGEKEVKGNPLKSKINEGTKGSDTVLPTDSVSNSPKLENIDSIATVDTDESDSILSRNIQSTSALVDLSEKDMATVWDKDVGSTLFPNTQSLVMQRLDEEEMMSMALAESIVTAQLEKFRFKDEETRAPDELHNESGDEWSTVRHNLPDTPKSDNDIDNQVGSKQCHDNNNNDAKSKTQSASDVKKGMQKTTTKVSTRKMIEPKTRKVTGTILKVSGNTPRQGSKEKDESVNLNNNDNDKASSFTTDVKKSSVAGTSKCVDRYGRVDSYSNRHLYMGKGERIKDQQYLRQSTPPQYDNNKSTSSMEGLDDKTKSVTAKFKSPKAESEKKFSEGDDTKKCHRVQITRTQTFNYQYNRTKSLVKPQHWSTKVTAKNEHDPSSSKQYTSDSTTNLSTTSASADMETKMISETEQTKIGKHSTVIHSNEQEITKGNEKTLVKSTSSLSYKGTLQNSPASRIGTEKKDSQGYVQKFKRESNVYRRSSDYAEPKYLSTKPKVNDQKRNVVDSNSPRDYKVNRPCAINVKLRSQPESTRTSVNSPKAVTGANKINKTDTPGSSTINNVQSVKSLNSSNGAKAPTTPPSVFTCKQQEPQTTQATFNGTEVQSVKKTEPEENSNNSSNNKPNINTTETKSVKFSDNVQEINASDHSVYSDNSVQQNKHTTNPFYTDIQNVSPASNVQAVEIQQTTQNKNYLESVAQYDQTINAQNSERHLQSLDILQQKPTEQAVHMPSQNISLHTSNPPVAAGTAMNYQNISGMYLDQYNNAQTIPRKSDCTSVSQNAPISTTSSYNGENLNLLQSEPTSVMVHNSQPSVLPPPGFHNHPITTQPNQWNLALPDMLCFGNMMSAAHPLNIPLQNSRHICSADFNNMQQTGYLQHPLFYMPPLCVQGWNPLLQYPAPLYQNPQYGNCNTFSNQVMPSTNLNDTMNCHVPSSTANNLYKHYHQMQQLENNLTYSAPVKVDNYSGNVHAGKSNNGRMKENAMVDGQIRAGQYRVTTNDYQNCSQDGQLMHRYIVPRTGQSNVQMQMNQKYHTPRAISGAHYHGMSEGSKFHKNQDYNKKDDLKNDQECIPPIVSPRESMFYGVNYSRKTENVPNPYMRSETKPMTYMHSGDTQHCVPQFHRNSNYHASTKEFTPRINLGRGSRKLMEQ